MRQYQGARDRTIKLPMYCPAVGFNSILECLHTEFELYLMSSVQTFAQNFASRRLLHLRVLGAWLCMRLKFDISRTV